MTTPELLKAFLELPEVCTVGRTQERAAFIAVHIERRTIREACEAIGVSKSQVKNLADLFQTKLTTRVSDLGRKRTPVSKEYGELHRALLDQLGKLQEESGSTDYDYDDYKLSREDWAEVTGTPLRDPDEWN